MWGLGYNLRTYFFVLLERGFGWRSELMTSKKTQLRLNSWCLLNWFLALKQKCFQHLGEIPGLQTRPAFGKTQVGSHFLQRKGAKDRQKEETFNWERGTDGVGGVGVVKTTCFLSLIQIQDPNIICSPHPSPNLLTYHPQNKIWGQRNESMAHRGWNWKIQKTVCQASTRLAYLTSLRFSSRWNCSSARIFSDFLKNIAQLLFYFTWLE